MLTLIHQGRRLAVRFRRRSRDERGVVLVIVTIMLVVLLAMAGFAVDYWHWSREGSRLQKTADAAALAGAIYMPDNLGTGFSTAKSVASRNGYTDGLNGVTITPSAGQLPTQLKVTVQEQVKNFFGPLVGAVTTTVTKHAVAEYEPAVNMGSPVNQFGNDPQSGAGHGTTRYPDLWANVFGPSSYKDKGDAIQSNLCTPGVQVDNCSGSNSDYDPNGYFYGVDVKPGATGPLVIQIYDPEFAHVGDNCGNNDTSNGAPGSNLVGASQLAPNFNPVFPVSDPATRYSPLGTSPYCSGDQYYSDGGNGLTPPWTDYTIRAPDNTPANPLDNPILCTKDFPGYLGDLKTALQQTTAQAGAPDPFVKYFRQWYTVCTIPNPVVGTYFVQVKTGTKANGSAAPNGGGANRFAIRASLNGDFTTSNASISGWGRMGIYANYPGANTTFYLARVLPGAPGRALLVNFFDVGDASNPGTLTVQPPPDSNVGSSFGGCTYTAPPGNSTGPPWGTFSNTASNCSISGVQTPLFNGQWITYRVPIPDSYTCTYTDPTGCWVRINFQFPSLSSVQDTTTWSAQIQGDPVRIVE